MSLFRLPGSEPLREFDAALAVRLEALLVETLRGELALPESEALRLADEVAWTVTRETDGLWLNLAHGNDVISAGGDPRTKPELLTLYVRQMAYDLAGREEDFEP